MRASLAIVALLTCLVTDLRAAADARYDVDVPGRLWYVAPDGDDAAAGSVDAPLRHIQAAADQAQAGDAILVDAGIYRERVAPPRGGSAGAPIVYRARPGTAVIIRGSDPWSPTWSSVDPAANIHEAIPDPSLFTDDVYHDSPNPFLVPLSANPDNASGTFTCGQVFLDGRPLPQRAGTAALDDATGCWQVGDDGAIRIRFPEGVDPTTADIEITTRRRVFAPHQRGLGYIHVIGFVIERCGNQFPAHFWDTASNAQAGALGTRSGHHWRIAHNLVRHATSIGADIGGESNEDSERGDQPRPSRSDIGYHEVIDNWFVDNGAVGLTGYLSTGIVVRGNVAARNNRLGFRPMAALEQAGIKFHGATDGLIERNLVVDNDSYGIWLDNDNDGVRVLRNLVLDNASAGIHLEMGDFTDDTILIAHNLLLGNRGSGVLAVDCSGITVLHNFIAGTRASGWQRGAGVYQHLNGTRGGLADSDHNATIANLILDNSVHIDANVPLDLADGRRFAANAYGGDAGARLWYINPYGSVPALSESALFDQVTDVLGAAAPDPVGEQLRAHLDLTDWQTYWQSSGGDAGAAALSGATWSLDRSDWSLRLDLPTGITGLTTPVQNLATRDYLGDTVPNDGSARPGPFVALPAGVSTRMVWDGLPLLRADATLEAYRDAGLGGTAPAVERQIRVDIDADGYQWRIDPDEGLMDSTERSATFMDLRSDRTYRLHAEVGLTGGG